MSFAGLIPLIHQLEDILDRLQLARSYGGAIACNFYAPPRFTQDVDVLVLIPAMKPPALVESNFSGLKRSWVQGDLSVDLNRCGIGNLSREEEIDFWKGLNLVSVVCEMR